MAKRCGRCGFETHPSLRLKSRHTGEYYCTNFKECDRRRRNELTDEEATILLREAERDVRRMMRMAVAYV